MTRKTGTSMLFDHKDTVRLAEDFGTPLFVFSQRKLEENAKGFLKSFTQADIPHRGKQRRRFIQGPSGRLSSE
jgi:diaminopimelate decarboxylase